MCKIKDTIIEEQDKVVDITKEVFYNKETMQIENVESKEEHESTPSAGDENMVECMRCGLVEEGDEKMVGDETYYLCEICDSDMNG